MVFYKNKWFTLIELVIAVTISMIIIWWLAYFIWNINNQMWSSKNKTKIILSVNDLSDKIQKYRSIYSWTWYILSGTWFDTLILSNIWSNVWGVIFWIVNINKNSTNYMKIDPPLEYLTYDKKVFGIRELTSQQYSMIQSWTLSIYDINFYEDNIYDSLLVKDFDLISFNSWKIFEAKFTINEMFQDDFLLNDLSKVPEVNKYDFLLDF